MFALQCTFVFSIQHDCRYKIGSATRSDRDLFDLEGPWYVNGTPWPDTHWDLNLQFLYQVMYTGLSRTISVFCVCELVHFSEPSGHGELDSAAVDVKL